MEISFPYKGVRCRERVKLKPTPANLKRAERHRAAIMDAIDKGTFDYLVTFPDSPRGKEFARVPGDALTIKHYLTQWLDDQKNQLKASTYDDYKKSVNNILIPAFGHLKLTDLKRKHIKAWGKGLTCSNKRIANILSPLRSALDEAVEDEVIDQNPLQGWTYSRKEEPKEDHVDPFNREEQNAILNALNGQGRNLIQFAFWSGLRTSELVALRWGDVDWIKGVVRVRRAQTQAAEDDETTKTNAGRRDVKLLDPALAALTTQKAWTFLAGEHVFHNPRTNEPWEGDQPIRKTLWTPALKKAGVAYRNPYQTRHTYASMMLSSGEHPMWVAKQMGHADWTMIARRYGKWMPDADPECGNRAVGLYAQPEDQQKKNKGNSQ
ncbi:tyrosine-type recombinase/integrase [Endozoicomonas acroporae]|uniref:tyrosine-type recombinase/integrase n=1 Tax=Endozoicomonas acroporae TaxID=1701104 RepID=UPI003B8469AA